MLYQSALNTANTLFTCCLQRILRLFPTKLCKVYVNLLHSLYSVSYVPLRTSTKNRKAFGVKLPLIIVTAYELLQNDYKFQGLSATTTFFCVAQIGP